MTTHFFADTAVLQGRSLRHILRSPDTIITTTIMPIAFLLLFVYVFGGAIETGSNSYVTYLLPGILLITIASGISYTAYRLFGDLQTGIFERFQSMPIARSAVWASVGPDWRREPGQGPAATFTGIGQAWHSHANGQTLHVTQGVARMQARGGDIIEVQPGQTVYTPPGEEHWHGATPGDFMEHIAMYENSDDPNATTVWGQHVTDEEYNTSPH